MKSGILRRRRADPEPSMFTQDVLEPFFPKSTDPDAADSDESPRWSPKSMLHQDADIITARIYKSILDPQTSRLQADQAFYSIVRAVKTDAEALCRTGNEYIPLFRLIFAQRQPTDGCARFRKEGGYSIKISSCGNLNSTAREHPRGVIAAGYPELRRVDS